MHPDEFVVFDSTQKNANNEECQWIKDPEWTVEDDNYVTQILGSSQPFLLRMNVTSKGTFKVQAVLDGIESNLLSVCSVKR